MARKGYGLVLGQNITNKQRYKAINCFRQKSKVFFVLLYENVKDEVSYDDTSGHNKETEQDFHIGPNVASFSDLAILASSIE